MPAGYSGTPLAKKLVIEEGQRVAMNGDPGHFQALVASLPEGSRLVRNPPAACQTFVAFTPTVERFEKLLPRVLALLSAEGSVWVS